MPNQRMVSMKMFLLCIGLFLVLNIGIGTALYKEVRVEEEWRREMDRLLLETIETKEHNLEREIIDLENDLYTLKNDLDNIRDNEKRIN